MEFLKRLLTGIRLINLTDIAKNLLSGVGGIGGWALRFFGGIFLKSLETMFDKGVKQGERNIQIKIEDEKLQEKAKANAEKIADAKTDAELDDAFRDSLK